MATQPDIRHGADFIGHATAPFIIHIDPDTLPPVTAWRPGDPIIEIPIQASKNINRPSREARSIDRDPLLNAQFDARATTNTSNSRISNLIVDISGANFGGTNPADTTGDVGNIFYLQSINHAQGSLISIYEKSNGSFITSFFLDTLANGSGSTCTNGRGDPIILFDETVDNGPGEPKGRWLLAEFTPQGINTLCIYISQTSNPTSGDWFLYEFDSISGDFPDYPKYAVWPDAYYLGVNERIGGLGGPHQYAFDRSSMLQGITARATQAFIAPALPGFIFQHIMPVDWDGDTPPPSGTPGLFIRHRDTEIHGPVNLPDQDIIELFEFSVDFNNPENSTFTGPSNIAISEFDSEFCNLIFSGCLEQPGTDIKLFALLQPIMWRAQYRHFGSHGSIVSNMITDVTGHDQGAVRWFELRDTGAGFTRYQEGTLSEPGSINGTDGINRWMASVAQDASGNIVAGYNVVGSGDNDVFPGIRYSGRLLSDPVNTMPQGEFSIIEGQQPNTSIRYGDYSSLAIDPNDHCTFWYTAQHNPSNNSHWTTRIASFRFDDCGAPGFILAADNLNQQVCTPDNLEPIIINVGSTFDFINPVDMQVLAPPVGFNVNFSNNPVIPGNTTTVNINASTDTPVGNHIIRLLGTSPSADDQLLTASVSAFNQTPSTATPTLPINRQILAPLQPFLSWDGGTQTATFIIEIDDDPNFGSLDYIAYVSGTTHTVAKPLDYSQLYFWRVKSSNPCGITTSQTLSFTTEPIPGSCPIDAETHNLFSDDIESGDNGWTHSGIQDTWQRTSQKTNSGDFAWFAEDVPSISDQQLTSPAITLPIGELPMTLSYQNSQRIERDVIEGACFDAGILEISTDDGTQWIQVPQSRLITDPYDGTVNNVSEGANPLSGLQGWCGDPEDFVESIIDLSAFQGETIRFRFRLGTDATIGRFNDGWFIDDIAVTSCMTIQDIHFDGFE